MTARTLAAAALLALAAGCSPGTGPAAPGPSTPSALVLDEHADGTAVRVAPGTVVRVELHSTYWSPAADDNPRTLRPTATATATATACRPGGGCGQVTAGFLAAAPGTARLSAHRTTCGEALACPPGQRAFTVTVTVSAD
ncbi:hypothetical protein ACIPLC_30245 [Kitasatospora sp. NPDC086801]|uniref:hypothetical protein n=1 Tax=Kitasatospora sp. NPDC086801 TaxID=3364066 RepID=UPI00381C2635